jgi:UDP-glucuronate decarboxylase
MRIVVAGGAGFIGSNLCDELLAKGHEVFCFDSLLSGRFTNIDHLRDVGAFHFFCVDITDVLPEIPRVDRVYHLASAASPPTYKAHAIETLRANSEGTWRLLELSRQNGARFLYVSSSEVYGDPLEHPQHEGYRGNVSSIGPRSMYDEAKRYGEALTLAHASEHGTDVRIVRLFNTYGPRSAPDDGRMVPNFITQALAGRPLTVYGSGLQTRSICYVADSVAGLIGVMESPAASGQVLNLGNPTELTVTEYAEAVTSAVGARRSFVYSEPAVGDDPQRRQPNIDRIRELVGWQPTTSLARGLLETVAYFRHSLPPNPQPLASVRSDERDGRAAPIGFRVPLK